MDKISAVVLGGGFNQALLEKYDTCYWALVPIRGEPMVQHVINALHEARIDDIVVMGAWTEDEKYQSMFPNCRLINGGERHIDNVENGLKAAGTNRVLMCSCDIPDLTGPIVSSFIDDCKKHEGAGFIYSIVKAVICEQRYPGIHRTCVRLREGEFTGGNVFMMDRRRMLNRMEVIKEIIAIKKSPDKLIRKFGLWFTLAFLLSRIGLPYFLTLKLLRSKASQILQMPVGVVVTWAEIASDIDRLEQLEAYLALREA